jgi:Mrp family chromosome partitioning ATPase
MAGLELIPRGQVTATSGELVSSTAMYRLIGLLRDRYDVILVDSAPVLQCADALMLTRVVDSVMLVLRSGMTERRAAGEALRRLKGVNARFLGAVLNDVDAGKQGLEEMTLPYSYVPVG